jgi:hypothetical protein
MSSGYSATPLFRKLGLREGLSIRLIHPPDHYTQAVGEWSLISTEPLDFIHFFTNSLSELESVLPQLKTSLAKTGMIWVSWYKRSAKKPTELSDTIVRDTALGIGLVDVKVCAVDDDWSALKLVYRLKDR